MHPGAIVDREVELRHSGTDVAANVGDVSHVYQPEITDATGGAEVEMLLTGNVGVGVDQREIDTVASGNANALKGCDAAGGKLHGRTRAEWERHLAKAKPLAEIADVCYGECERIREDLKWDAVWRDASAKATALGDI